LIRFLLLLVSLGCNYSFAENISQKQEKGEIEAKIDAFVKATILKKYSQIEDKNSAEKLQIKIPPIHNRYDLTLCKSPLKAKIIGDKLKSNTPIQVSCSDENNWNIYVRARVKILLPAVIATKRLSKGEVLNRSNIKIGYLDKVRMKNGGFTDLKSLYGARVKRNISDQRLIKHRDICIVCKDDKINIIAIKGSLRIKTSGIALADANIGGTVRVKNTHTQRIVVGVVQNLKTITVSF
jgi:flagella basal body P-ring formation protein FlgA